MSPNTQRASKLHIILAFAAVYLIWGSTYLAIRFTLESLPPFLLSGIRYGVAGVVMFVWARLRGAPAPSPRHWLSAAIVGGLLLMGGNGGVVWAETRVASGLAAVVIATVPMWMVLLEWFRGNRPGARSVVGLLLGFAGTWILIGPLDVAGSHAMDPLGSAALILAAMSWACGSIYARNARLPSAPLLATGMEMLCGGGLLIAVGLACGEWGSLHVASMSPRAVMSFVYLIVFGSLVGFTAYTWLLKVVATDKVATYAYVNPVVAVLLGWGFAGEPLTARTLLAAAIVLAAVVAVVSGRSPSPTRA